MTGLLIEIKDAGDKAECALALDKLFRALLDHHGPEGFRQLTQMWKNLHAEERRKLLLADMTLISALVKLSHERQRLLLAYYAMAKPSKWGLSRKLAAKNEDGEHYGGNGTTNPDNLLTQIKHIFRDYPDVCRIVGEAPPALRQRVTQFVEYKDRLGIQLHTQGRRWPKPPPAPKPPKAAKPRRGQKRT
jgi:hypothetical protein